MSDDIPQAPNGEPIMLQTEDGAACIECRFEWKSQGQSHQNKEVAP